MAEWLKEARFAGVLRYHFKNIGRLLTWGLLIILAVQLLSLLMPLFIHDAFLFDGIRGNFAIVFFGAFIAGIVTAGRGSRFLLRFGTARTSVWIGNVLGLLAGMVGLLAATFLINMLVAALLFPLSNIQPRLYAMSGGLYQTSLSQGLKDLPQQLVYTLEWTSIFYLYGCMLRRFKALTISFSIGIPLLFIVLMLIPTVRDGLQVLRGDDQGQILILGMNWLKILRDFLRFLDQNWETIQLVTGIVSLPLSYLVMRGTKQP